ncbi:hypothetical protein AVEN_42966-1 [Araneus ventricosus]|uniref:Uncharacterized protein n=1 Tax=Araneus ventricosus TaxID=182803 RepID=A0A4Y2AF77_ARAVE|nr:hypothetical protein AVEN_42966-1 [Araneus ventricosus]
MSSRLFFTWPQFKENSPSLSGDIRKCTNLKVFTLFCPHPVCSFMMHSDIFLCALFPFRFEAILGLFWDEPRNFKPQSDDEDNSLAGIPSPNFRGSAFDPRLRT